MLLLRYGFKHCCGQSMCLNLLLIKQHFLTYKLSKAPFMAKRLYFDAIFVWQNNQIM